MPIAALGVAVVSRTGPNVAGETKPPRGRSRSSGTSEEEQFFNIKDYLYENCSSWSSNTKLKILSVTPLVRWEQVSKDLEPYWNKIKSEGKTCTIQVPIRSAARKMMY